jgi:hypothetical protein
MNDGLHNAFNTSFGENSSRQLNRSSRVFSRPSTTGFDDAALVNGKPEMEKPEVSKT